ncbi:hypothetical protein HOY80DRAFT_996877 [Tuber brumale]|nr:hypothetical protein HOY80DRAFT_996877 [Tuber brumale]
MPLASYFKILPFVNRPILRRAQYSTSTNIAAEVIHSPESRGLKANQPAGWMLEEYVLFTEQPQAKRLQAVVSNIYKLEVHSSKTEHINNILTVTARLALRNMPTFRTSQVYPMEEVTQVARALPA